MLRQVIFILAITSINLFAEISDDLSEFSSLSDIKGHPSSVVGGMVNVITGHFVDTEIDLSLASPNSIQIQRSYNSVSSRKGMLGYLWDLNLHQDLEVAYTNREMTAIVSDQGSQFLFSGELTKRGASCDFDRGMMDGVTNGAYGTNSGRMNIINRWFWYSPNKGAVPCLYLETGERVYYDKHKSLAYRHLSYIAKEITRPNGTYLTYKYDFDDRIKAIHLYGKKRLLIDSVTFNYSNNFQKTPVWILTNSAGEKVEYHFKPTKIKKGVNKHHVLEKVIKSSSPTITYVYGKNWGRDVLSRKLWPDNRFVAMNYHPFEDRQALTAKGYDPVCYNGKVISLEQPAGLDKNPITTYQFRYFLDTKKKNHYLGSGHTEVLDAYGNRTDYAFCNEQRLYRIEYFEGEKKLRKRENFYWGYDPNKYDFTSLLARVIEYEKGEIELVRTWKYGVGAVISEEVISGNITGRGSVLPKLDDNACLVENGAEKIIKNFYYTKNCMVDREVEFRKTTTYSYWEKLDLLKLKKVDYKGQFFERTYFEYDAYGAPIVEINDDGNGDDINDLKGVTYRFIKRTVSTRNIPFGLPETVDELYFDFSKKKEVLLKRTRNSYSKEGYLLKRQIFDGDEKLMTTHQFKVDAMGNVVCEIEPQGREIHRLFDANQNCIQEISENVCINRKFDYSNRLIEEIEKHPDGYQQTKKYSYDFKGNCIEECNHLGCTTKQEYDVFNRLIRTTYSDGTTEEYHWDLLNNQTYFKDRMGFKKQTKYTIRGAPFSIIYPDGATEQFTYNLDGTLKEAVNQLGVRTHFEYDGKLRKIKEEKFSPKGELLSVQSWKYDSLRLLQECDTAGTVTNYSYDDAGRVISFTKEARQKSFSYDAFGRKCTIIEKINANQFKKTQFLYDSYDQILEEWIEDEKETLLGHKSYRYDCRGNKILEKIQSNDGFIVTETVYNTRSQPILIHQPDGYQTRFSYWDEGSFSIEERIDPRGVRWRKVYDFYRRLVQEEALNADRIQIQCSRFDYNAIDLPIKREDDIFADGGYLRTQHTHFKYDCMGRQIALVEASGSDVERTTQKEYNSRGLLVRQINPNGIILTYGYDFLDRLTHLNSSDGSVQELRVYDKNSNLIRCQNKENNNEFERLFDRNNRLVEEKLADDIRFLYTYDGLDRITTVTLPDKSQMRYLYNALKLIGIERIRERGNYEVSYNYDLSGKASSMSLPFEAGDVDFKYDSALRPTLIASQFFNEKIPEDGYDKAGNLVKARYSDFSGSTDLEYLYDDLSQLIEEKGALNLSYTYDSLNNRLQKDSVIYENNSANQLIKAGDEILDYDANGNLTVCSTKPFSFVYDALDRLVKYESNFQKVEFTYDSLHRRRSEVQWNKINDFWIQACEKIFLYQGDLEVGLIQNGVIKEFRLLGIGKAADAGAMIVAELPDRDLIALNDHRGCISVLVDAKDKTPLESLRYSGFGEYTITSKGYGKKSSLCPWTFIGKRFDINIQWFFFGRRWYDPKHGRFTTLDPLVFEDGFNRYAYVKNSPLLYIDPFGTNAAAIAMQYITQNKCYRPKKYMRFYDYDNVVNEREKRISSGGNYYESGIFVVEGKRFNHLGFGFINGISNTPEKSRESAEKLSLLGGGIEVQGVYNATHGAIYDLNEHRLNMKGYCTSPVQYLHETWDRFFEMTDNKGYFFQNCHSNGCAQVRNALETYDEERRRRITVLAIAPGAIIYPDTCESVVHIVSRDFVIYNDHQNMLLYQDTIIYADPHESAPLFDHPYDSPTYEPYIKDEIIKFIQKHGEDL